MFSAYTSPPYFYDDQEISATSLKILRDNHIILDTMAQRGFQAQRVRNINAGVGVNPFYIWRGSFQYKVGLTSAVIKVFCGSPVGENLVVRLNGTIQYNAAMTTGVNTVTIFMPAALGYTDNQIVLVDVQAQYPSGPVQNTYVMQEAYVTPVSGQFSASWVAPVTFGSITATNLNKLVDAQQYLYYLLSSPALPLQMSTRWAGGFWGTGDVTTLATYRFARHGNNDRLRVIMDYRSRHNQSTTINFNVNGSSLGSFTFGQWLTNVAQFDLNITGLTLDTPARLEVVETINTGPVEWRGAVNTKYNIRLVETLRSGGYIAPTLPTESQMLESMTFSTLQSRLNTLGTAISQLKTDTDNRAIVLNRSYMFSRRPVDNDDQEDYLKWTLVARKKRQGNVLVVKGKDLRIGWGYEAKLDVDKPEYEFSNEESLISGDNNETKVYYLDKFDGLEVGFPYFIMGSLIEYAAEYYRY